MATSTDLWGSREWDNTVNTREEIFRKRFEDEKRKQLEIDDREMWRQHEERQRKLRNTPLPPINLNIKPR